MPPAHAARLLLPSGAPSIRARTARRLPRCPNWLLPAARRSAATKAGKPIVLEKPARFNPPSHPSRLVKRAPQGKSYGGELSEKARQAQRTKRYPHMMPPEGTFMHRFITNREWHMRIGLATLLALAATVFIKEFHRKTPYYDLLPARAEFFSNPFAFLKQYIEIYRMDYIHHSEEIDKMQNQRILDAQKRAEFRKAHGISNENTWVAWIERKGVQYFGEAPVKKQKGVKQPVDDGAGALPEAPGEGTEAAAPSRADNRSAYTDFEGNKQPVKKWLGIW